MSNCRCLRVRSDGTRELDPYGSVFLWEPELTVLTCRLAPSSWCWDSCPESEPGRRLGWGQGIELVAASTVAGWLCSPEPQTFPLAGVACSPTPGVAFPHTVISDALTRVSAWLWCPVQHSIPPDLPAGQVWAPRAAWELGTPSEQCSFCIYALRPGS